jgi:hypothetical protein
LDEESGDLSIPDLSDNGGKTCAIVDIRSEVKLKRVMCAADEEQVVTQPRLIGLRT